MELTLVGHRVPAAGDDRAHLEPFAELARERGEQAIRDVVAPHGAKYHRIVPER
jgi:hypothetical protein